jgi:hypothetical protein
MQVSRRGWWWVLAGGAGAALAGCAGLVGQDAVSVNVVGLEPLPGEGLEVRMAVKLRVQNPNDTALDFDGLSIELDLHGAPFASGVSGERGRIGRFGELVLSVPVSVSALAVLRQVLALANAATGASPAAARVDYALRGRLAGPGFGGMRFAASGEIDLPRTLGGR